MTLYLAFLCLCSPTMRDVQPISIVWVDTLRDTWIDTSEDLQAIKEALDWWEIRADVEFVIQESSMSLNDDPYSYDICHDRSWASPQRAIYMISNQQTNRYFSCDGVLVADWADTQGAYVGGGVSVVEMAHTIGHFFGATDKHETPSRIGSGDIMDFRSMNSAYRLGIICPETWKEIGSHPK